MPICKSTLIVTSAAIGLAMGAVHHFEDQLTQSNAKRYGTTVLSYNGHSDTLRQSFLVQAADPKTTSVLGQMLFLKTYFWGGSGATYRLQIRPGDIDSVGAPVLLSYDFTKLYAPDPECGILYGSNSSYIPLSPKLNPDTLMAIYNRTNSVDSAAKYYATEGFNFQVGKKYTFSIIATNLPQRSYGYYNAETDDPNGRSNFGADVWFQLAGFALNGVDQSLKYQQVAGNQFFLDTVGHPFTSKLVGLGTKEKLSLIGNGAGSLSFLVQNPSIASIHNLGGNPQIFEIQGNASGSTLVYVLRAGDTASVLQVDVVPKRYLDLSYTYIRHPSEDTTAMTKIIPQLNGDTVKLVQYEIRKQFAGATAVINKIYDSLNVALNWTDNGIVNYDWDFNNDQNSYTAAGDESWSPLDSNLLPNASRYYTNLYIMRDRFPDVGATSQSGGGSSRDALDGQGKPKRGAYKRVALSVGPGGIGSTLAHELGHNLGLWHYSAANQMLFPTPYPETNLMHTGRNYDQVLGMQWRVLHDKITTRIASGENYAPSSSSGISSSSSSNTVVAQHSSPVSWLNVNKGLLKFEIAADSYIRLIDASGRSRWDASLASGVYGIELSASFAPGTYWLELTSHGQRSVKAVYLGN